MRNVDIAYNRIMELNKPCHKKRRAKKHSKIHSERMTMAFEKVARALVKVQDGSEMVLLMLLEKLKDNHPKEYDEAMKHGYLLPNLLPVLLPVVCCHFYC